MEETLTVQRSSEPEAFTAFERAGRPPFIQVLRERLLGAMMGTGCSFDHLVARRSMSGGIVRPSASAVFKLMASAGRLIASTGLASRRDRAGSGCGKGRQGSPTSS